MPDAMNYYWIPDHFCQAFSWKKTNDELYCRRITDILRLFLIYGKTLMAFPSNLSYIKPSEPVSAAVTNRPIQQLDQRSQFLKKSIETLYDKESIIFQDYPVSKECQEGTPVYWNTENLRFEPAFLNIQKECDTGEYRLGPESDCLGLVYSKLTSTSANIIGFGVVDLPQIRSFLPSGDGRFYLGVNAGSLTFDVPAVEKPIGVILGTPDPCSDHILVYVNPEFVGRAFQHVHYSHVLNRELWADAETFPKSPTGAAYGYQIDDDPDLKKIFPPVPIESCRCTIDWDGNLPVGGPITETFGGRDIPVNEENSLICIDNNGIWWMSSEINPAELDSLSNSNSPYRGFRVTVHFSRVLYANNKVYVTKLAPGKNEPFLFTDCDGNEADSGSLFAHFTLGKAMENSDDCDGRALKWLSDDWKQIRVPVIHGIRSTTRCLKVTGSTFSYNNEEYHNGILDIGVIPYAEDYELRPQVVKLTEALESEYQGIQYLALPSGRASSFSMKMEVPGVFGENLRLKMRFLCLARIGGTFPELNLSYMKLPRPKDGAISLANHVFAQDLALDSQISVEANTIFEFESDEIEVNEGDTVIVTLGREASSVFASDAGVIRATGILNIGDSE